MSTISATVLEFHLITKILNLKDSWHGIVIIFSGKSKVMESEGNGL